MKIIQNHINIQINYTTQLKLLGMYIRVSVNYITSSIKFSK